MAMTNQMFLEREEKGAVAVGEKTYSDEQLLEIFKRCKKESFENRWIWERGWMRNIHYANNRHWIEYVRRSNEWRDVRLAKWFPKPVTPMIQVGVQALRAMFAAVDIGVNVRPNGSDPKNVAVAAIADDYAPVLHEEHDMESVLNEADFWFVTTGNVFLHTYLDRDVKYGVDVVTYEQCMTCGTPSPAKDIVDAQGKCPECGGTEFQPAVDPLTGEPLEEKIPRGKGVTNALSPFELAFPSSYARFEDVPYVIRLRWRSKSYYENHPTLKSQVMNHPWAKAPNETSLQLFRSLPYHNDMGVAPFLGSATGNNSEEEGAPEYEITFRPCNEYPEGFVFRVMGDGNPIVLHLEQDEALPGPLPYRDAEGNPIFTYSHAAFEQKGGRVWGSSPLDAAIHKQNTLNQHDAFGLMVVNRVANPLWLVPKGAEIEKFTGEPGLVVKWNPLTVGGNAKPERVDGVGLGGWFFQMREQHMRDIEEALGTSDVLKGTKPAGVEAFAALQLLVERGQSRFASAFKARGRMYRDWFKFALEIEREFGPDERTKWVLSPARKWTEKIFKSAQLQGSFSILVEEGSQTPKTALGMRAAIEHLNSLGFIDPTDSDQRYAIFQAFGQTKLSPALDIHMQAALRKQQEFEEWAKSPELQQESFEKAQADLVAYEQQLAMMPPPPEPAPQVDPATGQPMPAPGPDPAQMQAMMPPPPPMTRHTPLEWMPWFKADIHKQEFLKWANGDSVVQLLRENPPLKELLIAHMQEIDMALQEQMLASRPLPEVGLSVSKQAGGAGMAMSNSNQEAGGTGAMPGKKGAAQEAA